MIAKLLTTILIITNAATFAIASAGEADIVDVRVQQTADHTYRFDVTVKHDDTGWEHYANRWDVLAPDGTVLGSRELLHPHVNEQPFTRSLSGVKIPADIKRVTVQAHDSIHETGGTTLDVELPQ